MNCNLCPHNCNIDRTKFLGKCKSHDKIKIGGYGLYNFEEPCISGKNGSGAIFFSKCNLNCVYCQNYEISNLGKGTQIEEKDLIKIFFKLQNEKAENINLISPTIYIDKIVKALKVAKNKGLKIPIIYNTSGYEKMETIKKLNGIIDVYLPDFKYFYDELGEKYSGVKNYFEITSKVILEMEKQVGEPEFDKNGMIKKGLIIRHLVLPNHLQNSKEILKWIKKNLNNKIYVSIMTQYFPTFKSKNYEEINRKLTKKEYEEIEEFIEKIDIKNGYMQDFSDDNESEENYVPKWNYKDLEIN